MAIDITADVCIIGSGFAGSLLATGLARAGMTVVMIDRGSHPRFAVGESSTPLADFSLEQIGQQFDIPEVLPLCRWGSWQRELPGLQAGKKRGFSYFAHRRDQPFGDGPNHANSFLVAASVSDAVSDTHWLRSDVDQWFCQLAIDSGVTFYDASEITRIQSTGNQSSPAWEIRAIRAKGDAEDAGQAAKIKVDCQMVVDSSGAGGVLGKQLGGERRDSHLKTQTASMFGHFVGVGAMRDVLGKSGVDQSDDPFNPDDAAQHHILEDGRWLWMLRFASGTTSVGLTGPSQAFGNLASLAQRDAHWQAVLDQYPTLAALMAESRLVAPERSGVAQMGWMPRIGRLWQNCAGPGWAMLPSTAGVIDPLHSTGIAHSLSGVRRLLEIVIAGYQAPGRKRWQLQTPLAEYSQQVVLEVEWIDSMVSLAYQAMGYSFRDFTAVCSFYFLAAIHCEREMVSRGSMRRGFLMSSDAELQELCLRAQVRLARRDGSFADWLRSELVGWNDVGLLDPASLNRIARSSAQK